MLLLGLGIEEAVLLTANQRLRLILMSAIAPTHSYTHSGAVERIKQETNKLVGNTYVIHIRQE
jgi:hypothetical protein